MSLTFKIGFFLVASLILLALFAPSLAPYSPLEDFRGFENLSPFAHHRFLLGTDSLGRDLLSRLIYGSRYCLLMGGFSVMIALLFGVPLGLFAGYNERADFWLTKGSDLLMSFPSILIAIVIVAILGPGLLNACFAVGITNVPAFFRLTRVQTKAEARKDYVSAAISLGASDVRLLTKHILPNIFSSLLIFSSLSAGTAVLESAALSFLNLGVTPPTPEWGSMINSGRETLLSGHPWVSILSGLCIFGSVLGFNLLGDSLQDRWDPLRLTSSD